MKNFASLLGFNITIGNNFLNFNNLVHQNMAFNCGRFFYVNAYVEVNHE